MWGKTPEQQYKNTIIFFVIGLLIIAVSVFLVFSNSNTLFFKITAAIFYNFWWLILPIPLYQIFRSIWDEYTGLVWALSIEKVLLEIVPPANIEKSPKIMEQVFAGLHTFSTQNKFEVYCGWRADQDRYSFEIVSLEGAVKFFVRCPKAARNNVEAQIYAQYPEAEIREAEKDYTFLVPKNIPNPEWDLWGSTLKLVAPDPVPIRTYRHFKEDITGKMIDPLASLIEVFSSFEAGQYGWFQVVFSPEVEHKWHPESIKYIERNYLKKEKKKEMGSLERFFNELMLLPKNVIRALLGEELETVSQPTAVEEKFNINELPPGEQDKLKAIYDNISKPGFKTVMRYVYVGKRERFNKALGVAGVMGAIKQFADPNLNSIVPDNETKTFANYYFTEPRLSYRQRKILQDYRDRVFNVPAFIFNIEELATVFHFPDMEIKVPTLQRVETRKGEAPSNLPFSPNPIF